MPDLFGPAQGFEKKLASKLLRQVRGSTDSLIGGRRGLHIQAKDEKLFLLAMQEAMAYHFLNSPSFRALCRDTEFFPWKLRRSEQLPDIPYYFVTALKYHTVQSVPNEKVAITLHSSGTTGQRSAIPLDKTSLRRIKRIVRHIYLDLGMVNLRRTNYLCFTYDPEVASDVGTAFSDKLLTGLTRVHHVHYAIEWDDQRDDWHLNVDRVQEALERFDASRRPFRLLGFPAHTWEVLKEIVERRGQPFRFGPNSHVIVGGGWKGFEGEIISPPRFRLEVGRWLGIPSANVRDLYGMVEHGVPYCECEHHRMHVPRYSRVFVREPATLKKLPHGESGLLQFVTPYHHSFPAISLLTTDFGHTEPDCPCGRRSPVVVMEGRAGVSKHKGCAIAALKVRASL